MEMLLSAATVLLLHEWVISLMEHKTTSVHNIAGLPQGQRFSRALTPFPIYIMFRNWNGGRRGETPQDWKSTELASLSIHFHQLPKRQQANHFFPCCHFSIQYISRDNTTSTFPFSACFACSDCTLVSTLWLTSARENTVNRKRSRRKLLGFERLDLSILHIWETLSQLKDNHCFRAERG